MTDFAPHNRNRLGWLLGYVFHPFTIFIPALVVVLKDTPRQEALGWIGLVGVLLTVPPVLLIQRARRRQRYTYQRETRHVLYGVAWLNLLLCVGLAVAVDASSRLIFALLVMTLWLPLQYVINARLTKISAHSAIITGIVAALVVLGEIDSLPLALAGAGAVLATAWARVVTGNHTTLQVSLGIVVSIGAVLIAAALMAI